MPPEQQVDFDEVVADLNKYDVIQGYQGLHQQLANLRVKSSPARSSVYSNSRRAVETENPLKRGQRVKMTAAEVNKAKKNNFNMGKTATALTCTSTRSNRSTTSNWVTGW